MDLGVATSGRLTREFSAVVIAGFGNEYCCAYSPSSALDLISDNRLVPLTSNNGSEPCPKALIPVANKPMIDYVLSWIEQAGVKGSSLDVLLICPSIHRPMISHHVHSGLSTLHIDVQTYDESPESNTGTCTLLRHFASRISEDFILLPCDFIPPPSLSLSTILNKNRTESLSDGSVATVCWFAALQPDKNSLVEDWGSIPPSVPIVWDDATETLLQVDTADDLDQNSEELELRMSLLSQYPRTKLSNRYQDSHVYVCRRSILDLLHEKKHFDSFREEFIPWLCKIQYQRTKREKYGHILNPITNVITQDVALKHSTLRAQKKVYSKSVLYQSNDADALSPFDPESTTDSSSLRVGLVLHPATAGFATRVNNIHSLLDINRRLLAETTYSLPTDSQSRSLIDPKAQISSDTMIGAFTQISERTTIKKSVIGKHCVIGKMARITGCVLLDHCVIEDGAKVDGCILGKNTKVGAKAELSRCVSQAGYEVGSGESFKNEKLDVSDWTAGRDDSEEDEDEEDEDEEEEESDDDDEGAVEDSEDED
ncbi:UDP-3-O-glucosamine N-acyltransferase [Lentinula boryana]|uniref:Translation initiation factor eIF2B subunit gamma n=1 Tax=Lentinula boryana TaxID=40481 RepID=A0ABQ8QG83_9AGAR|nr:UDP-3-O-glucosamine N-acyltransferase [Lentinula boryana]